MFTGIIEGVGKVTAATHQKTHTKVQITSSFSLKGTKLGDSIAVNGCCLTATQLSGKTFSADISPETLQKTTLGEIKKGDWVNLERPLRLDDRLGGHLVQGHVDGVGKITSNRLIQATPDSYHIIQVRVSKKLSRYMIQKGSVAIDGISLTINELKGNLLSLCIIPHTQTKTTLTNKQVGDKVNVEVDMMFKFAEKLLS